jgi:hypothetical protein
MPLVLPIAVAHRWVNWCWIQTVDRTLGTKNRLRVRVACGLDWLLILCLASSLAGCRARTGEVSPVQTNLSWLGSMYGMYIGTHKGESPKTIDDLRKFVERKTSAEQLARLKVANVSELFVSPRDGKRFVMISYAKLPAPIGGEPAPVVLYEAAGQGGMRAVAYLGGGTGELDEAELKSMLPTGKR